MYLFRQLLEKSHSHVGSHEFCLAETPNDYINSKDKAMTEKTKRIYILGVYIGKEGDVEWEWEKEKRNNPGEIVGGASRPSAPVALIKTTIRAGAQLTA